MFTFGYTSRKSRAIKAAFVLLLGFLLMRTRSFGLYIIGAGCLFIGARDLWVVYREYRLEHKKDEPQQRPEQPRKEAPQEEGKVRITDLSEAREVDYTKE